MNKVLQSIINVGKQETEIADDLDQAIHNLIEGSVSEIKTIPLNGSGHITFDVVQRSSLPHDVQLNIEGQANVIQLYNSAGEVVQRMDAVEWDGVIDDTVDTVTNSLSRDITYVMSEVRESIDYHECVEGILQDFSCSAKVAKTDLLGRCDTALSFSDSNYDIKVLRSYIQSLPGDTVLPTDLLAILKQLYGASKTTLEEETTPDIPQTGFLVTTSTITMVLKSVLEVIAGIIMILTKLIGLIVYGIIKIFSYITQALSQGEIEWNPDVFNDLYSAPLTSNVFSGDAASFSATTVVPHAMERVAIGSNLGYAMINTLRGQRIYTTAWPKASDGDVKEYSVGVASYLCGDIDPYKFWSRCYEPFVTIRKYTPSNTLGLIFSTSGLRQCVCFNWDMLLCMTHDLSVYADVHPDVLNFDLSASDDRIAQIVASEDGAFKLLKTSLLLWALGSLGLSHSATIDDKFYGGAGFSDSLFLCLLSPDRPAVKENSSIITIIKALIHDFTSAVTTRTAVEATFYSLFSNDDALNAVQAISSHLAKTENVMNIISVNPVFDDDPFYCISSSLDSTSCLPNNYGYAISGSPLMSALMPGLRGGHSDGSYDSSGRAASIVANRLSSYAPAVFDMTGFPQSFSYDLPSITKGKALRVGLYTSLITGVAIASAFLIKRRYVKSRTKKMVDRSIMVEDKLAAYKANPTAENYKAYTKSARKYNKIANSLGYSPVGILSNKTSVNPDTGAPMVDLTDQVSSYLGSSDMSTNDNNTAIVVTLISGD